MLQLNSLIDHYLPLFKSLEGSFLFILLYALWVTFLLPGGWASMVSGFIYGTWKGSLIVFIGAFIGAELSFVLSRFFIQRSIQNLLLKYPKFKLLDKVITGQGLKLILLTRLSPVFPFSLLNFAYGITKISSRDFTIGLIGILPGTILFCGLGELAGNLTQFGQVLSEESDIKRLIINSFGLLATLLVVWLVTRASKKAFQEFESCDES